MEIRTGDATPEPLYGAGGRRFLVDGLRVEADDAGVHFARQRLFGNVVLAVELDGCWVFMTERGVVARSETFLGDVARIGEVPPPRSVPIATRGRLAIIARGGAMYVTDGRTVVAAGPTRAPVVAAAFAYERGGAAVLQDGGLAVTSDGGASWRDVDLGRDVALDVYSELSTLRVRTSRGWSTLGPDLLLSPPERVAPSIALRAPPFADPASLAAVRAALGARATGDPIESAHRLADGTSVRLRGCTLEHVGRDGAVLASSTLLERYGTCELRPWGRAFAVRAEGLYRTEDGESLSLVYPGSLPREVVFDADMARLHFARDGVHLAVERPCAPRAGDAPRTRRACVLLDGVGAWREVPLPADEQRMAGMHGARMLYSHCAEDACQGTVVDAEAGEARPVTLAPRPDAVGAALVSTPRWTRDGALVAVAGVGRGPNAPRWLALGDPGGPLALLPLRAGTIDVVFDDRTRGYAIGPDLGAPSRTLDGGRTWEPLGAWIDGPIAHGGYDPQGSRCDAEGCVLSGWLSIQGWGPLRPPTDRWLSMLRTERAVDAPPEDAASEGPTRLRCTSEGPARPSPWADPTERSLRSRWPAGVVRVVRGAPTRAQGSTLSVAWAGEGVRPGSASLPLRSPDAAEEFVALGAGARGPILYGPRGLVASWAPRAEPIALDGLAWGFQSSFYSRSRPVVLPTADGGAVVALPGETDAYTLTVVARVSSEGRLTAARAIRPRALAWGLAQVRGRYALVERLADGRLRATPVGDGPPEVLASLPARLAVCAGAPARDATVVTWASEPESPLVAIDAFQAVTLLTEVAITPSGACLVGVTAQGAWAPHPRPQTLLLRASQGRLEGYRDDRAARHALRCEVIP